MPFKADRNIGVTMISTIIFLNEEGKFVENVLVLMNK